MGHAEGTMKCATTSSTVPRPANACRAATRKRATPSARSGLSRSLLSAPGQPNAAPPGSQWTARPPGSVVPGPGASTVTVAPLACLPLASVSTKWPEGSPGYRGYEVVTMMTFDTASGRQSRVPLGQGVPMLFVQLEQVPEE